MDSYEEGIKTLYIYMYIYIHIYIAGKLKRIKTQVMSRHPWHSGKRAALE